MQNTAATEQARPERPANPVKRTDYGWTPWTAPLFVASFAWIPVLLAARLLSSWTLGGTVPALVIGLLLFWRHQRNLPGVSSWWHR